MTWGEAGHRQTAIPHPPPAGSDSPTSSTSTPSPLQSKPPNLSPHPRSIDHLLAPNNIIIPSSQTNAHTKSHPQHGRNPDPPTAHRSEPPPPPPTQQQQQKQQQQQYLRWKWRTRRAAEEEGEPPRAGLGFGEERGFAGGGGADLRRVKQAAAARWVAIRRDRDGRSE